MWSSQSLTGLHVAHLQQPQLTNVLHNKHITAGGSCGTSITETPRIEPYCAPHATSVCSDEKLPADMKKFLLFREKKSKMDRESNLNRAETFSFVNPWIRYFLFFFSFLFWVFSLLIVGIGVYAKVQKATDTVRDTFLIDPAVILIVVGVVMFFITFCGCIGALRENIRLLKTFSFTLTLVFLIQLVIAVLGFFHSDQVYFLPGETSRRFCADGFWTRDALGKFVKKAIVHYRDDLDLQNLMDYIQKEFKCCGWNSYTDWSWNLYFNCSQENPSSERCAVPYSCCTPVPGETVINTMCGFGIQMQQYQEVDGSIYSVGCAERAVLWIESHLLLVGALTLGLALPQIAGIVLSQILISQIQDEIASPF